MFQIRIRRLRFGWSLGPFRLFDFLVEDMCLQEREPFPPTDSDLHGYDSLGSNCSSKQDD